MSITGQKRHYHSISQRVRESGLYLDSSVLTERAQPGVVSLWAAGGLVVNPVIRLWVWISGLPLEPLSQVLSLHTSSCLMWFCSSEMCVLREQWKTCHTAVCPVGGSMHHLSVVVLVFLGFFWWGSRTPLRLHKLFICLLPERERLKIPSSEGFSRSESLGGEVL